MTDVLVRAHCPNPRFQGDFDRVCQAERDGDVIGFGDPADLVHAMFFIQGREGPWNFVTTGYFLSLPREQAIKECADKIGPRWNARREERAEFERRRDEVLEGLDV